MANTKPSATQVKYKGETVYSALERAEARLSVNNYRVTTYNQLYNYGGTANVITVVGPLVTASPTGISGEFSLIVGDTTSVAIPGILLVGADGRRWMRNIDGNVQMSWADADRTGINDATAKVQAILAYCRKQGGKSKILEWNTGTYHITGTLTLGTEQVINFEPGVIIDFHAPNPATTMLFSAAGQRAVYLNGNGTIVKGNRGVYADGSALHIGLFVYGSKNVVARNIDFQDFGVDGLTLDGDETGSGPCENVLIDNCTTSNCGRNGLSIISVRSLTVLGGDYRGSSGSVNGPCAGIDIEPNYNSFCEGITLVNVQTRYNAWAGLQITLGALTNSATKKNVSITVIGGNSQFDGAPGRGGGLYLVNGDALGTMGIGGSISITGFNIAESRGSGVIVQGWDEQKMPKTTVKDFTVTNPGISADALSNIDLSGVVVRALTGDVSTSVGGVVFSDVTAQDTRSTKKMTYSYYVAADSGSEVKNVKFRNPKSVGALTPASSGFGFIGSGFFNSVTVEHDGVKTYESSLTEDLRPYVGANLMSTANFGLYTLPPSASVQGAVYRVSSKYNTTVCQLNMSAADKVHGFSKLGKNISIKPGGHLYIAAVAGGWELLSQFLAAEIP